MATKSEKTQKQKFDDFPAGEPTYLKGECSGPYRFVVFSSALAGP
jgi:hypothetical protein